jgi:glycosyltransferase involved in cell wall biosynthesis
LNNFLFNFAASYSGGGHKRLYEYAKWFHRNGGARFIIHPRCGDLMAEFPNNDFLVVRQSYLQRSFNDCGYLDVIGKAVGQPDLYYSYGVPIYSRFGKVNWFHLSNVLPLGTKAIPLSAWDRAKVYYLGRRIRRGFTMADVISAESQHSLDLMHSVSPAHLFLSVNGSNDELAGLQSEPNEDREVVATVVGTYRYKALEDAFRVFEMLKESNNQLRLAIIGNVDTIPTKLRRSPDVDVRGTLARPEVINCLLKSRYYISTTYIENSYNAAAEGIFLAQESYISDIGPHRELLMNMHFDEVIVPRVGRRLLHIKRADLRGTNLKTWEMVIAEMIARFDEARRGT